MTLNLITEAPTKSLTGIHWRQGWFPAGEKEQDGERFPHTTQRGMQFETHDFFISGLSQLTFADLGWWQVTDTSARETKDKRTTVHTKSYRSPP